MSSFIKQNKHMTNSIQWRDPNIYS